MKYSGDLRGFGEVGDIRPGDGVCLQLRVGDDAAPNAHLVVGGVRVGVARELGVPEVEDGAGERRHVSLLPFADNVRQQDRTQ